MNHYTLTLKFIHETDIDNGEFYLFKNSSDWYVVEYYSKNEKDRCKIEIDFRDKCLFQTMDKSALKGANYNVVLQNTTKAKDEVYLASIMEEKRKVT